MAESADFSATTCILRTAESDVQVVRIQRGAGTVVRLLEAGCSLTRFLKSSRCARPRANMMLNSAFE
jgi:hypothetical protein